MLRFRREDLPVKRLGIRQASGLMELQRAFKCLRDCERSHDGRCLATPP